MFSFFKKQSRYFSSQNNNNDPFKQGKVLELISNYFLYKWSIFSNLAKFVFPEPGVLAAKRLTQQSIFEILWTVLPAIILVVLAFPSMKLLYSLDFLIFEYEPIITIKVIGHQWFWSYEYVVFSLKDELSFTGEVVAMESYLLPESEIGPNGLRLLEVDNPLVLPSHFYIRFLVTSVDVLHSWAVPALGIKVDAVPGRLNQIFTFIKRDGNFYGQCSEICGVNHGFMPIRISAKLNP